MLAALALYSSYSYSEIVHETTLNAATDAQQWVMSNLIKQQTGLTINSVTYQYTTIKETQDEMLVSIRNKHLGETGYIFQSIDDWSGLPGNTITKRVPVENGLYSLWGDGEINVQGNGLVTNASVFYNYSYDPCDSNPLFKPTCPGYDAAWAKRMLELVPESTLLQEEVIYTDNETDVSDYYEEEESLNTRDEESEERERRKRLGIKAAENTITQANQISQSQLIEAMNYLPEFQTYYMSAIAGGVYADSELYKPKNLPENKKGLRVGLAQQVMHEKMVNGQYNK